MRRLLLSSLVGLSLAVAACSGSTTSTEPSTASAAQGSMTTAPVAAQATGHMRAFADALSAIPLRADQRADIEQMASDAETRHAATKTAHAQLAEAVAAQIEAGAIDRTELQPKLDAMTAAVSASRPADRAAFEHLHAILTADQRAQFVDAMEARGKAKGEHGMHGRLEQWAKDLQLTDDQQAQIRTILQAQFAAHTRDKDAAHAGHEHGRGFLESFKNDQLPPPAAPAGEDTHAHDRAGAFLDVVAQVLPILTPAQRTLAAAKLRARAQSDEEVAPGLGD